jgi:DNA ligase-4
MQPTLAPSSRPGSPSHITREDVGEQTIYPAPPQNVDSAPFSVLVALFEKLQAERKPERRRKLLDAWFNVRSLSYRSRKICI